jgi:hypothetical protein
MNLPRNALPRCREYDRADFREGIGLIAFTFREDREDRPKQRSFGYQTDA